MLLISEIDFINIKKYDRLVIYDRLIILKLTFAINKFIKFIYFKLF